MTPTLTPTEQWLEELESRKAALEARMEGLSGVALEEAEMEFSFIGQEIERFRCDFCDIGPRVK